MRQTSEAAVPKVIPTRRTTLLALGMMPFAAHAQQKAEFYPIPVELLMGLDEIQGKVTLGNPQAELKLIEFFDYNCGYCRQAARDIRPLLTANRDVAVVLVNYAVLGIPSIGATRVALAFSKQKGAKYLDFHQQMFEVRGTRGDDAAIAIALKLGANKAQLLKDADSEAVTNAMLTAARVGEKFGFMATPSYLLGREGYAGFLTLAQKQAAIDEARKAL
jgi:protein-disulfide isomerase